MQVEAAAISSWYASRLVWLGSMLVRALPILQVPLSFPSFTYLFFGDENKRIKRIESFPGIFSLPLYGYLLLLMFALPLTFMRFVKSSFLEPRKSNDLLTMISNYRALFSTRIFTALRISETYSRNLFFIF